MNDDLATRVLLLTPTRKDGEITSALLAKAVVASVVCRDIEHLVGAIHQGAGAILLTEEVINAKNIQLLLDALQAQPPWSDIPVVMLMKSGVASLVATKVLHDLRNVTLLERPAPTRSVTSAVQAAIRGRQRQYQIRDQIEAIRAGQSEREQLLESERAARQAAERADRIKDEFLATLSHELRTPLNAIYGWVQLIKLSPGDTDAVAEGVEVIDRNVRVQTQLIEDLLDVSRIISGKVRLNVKRVELADVISAALESVLPALLAKEIRLQKVIDTDTSAVSGDPARLQQVFWNLLTNAAKFTPRRGKIQIVAERVASHLEVSVIDTGEGIDPEFLPLLFERFSQADGSTTRSHGGLGLGRSSVRNLVEMHGGTIIAKSPGVNQGATFTVRLPLRVLKHTEPDTFDRPDCRANGSLLGDSSQLKGLKILVVDDEADSRDLVGRILSGCDAIPALAASAAEAQSLLPDFAPNVIISDIGMPIQDGYSFMRNLRSQGIKTPALALTAFARPEDRIRAIQAGYQMHLRKPVDPAELITVIASLAGRYDAANRN
jgi:signal transduction histidine kinase/ActR/RegA family two-component response regulator